MRELPEPQASLVRAAFAVRRAAWRARHPRLSLGDGVMPIGRLVVRNGTRVTLGDRVRVRQTVRVVGGGHLVVGSDTLLNGCWVVATGTVTIGDRCLISDCGITDSDFHNLPPQARHLPPEPSVSAPVVVEDNVWIGLRALVLKGVRVGRDSVVGAGAVVREEVPAGVVVAGNPAVVVKRFEQGDGAGAAATAAAGRRAIVLPRETGREVGGER